MLGIKARNVISWDYVIDGLLEKQVKLKKRVWLKQDELVIDKKGDSLHVYVLGDHEGYNYDEMDINAYLWVASLLTHKSSNLLCNGGSSINSKKEFGQPSGTIAVSQVIFDEAAAKAIGENAHLFLNFIRDAHDKYINVINSNKFIRISLEFIHDSQKKHVTEDDGFISAMISLESLFNESPSDIRHKLSHRAAFLLGFCGYEPTEVFENLKKLYNERSQLVHGTGNAKLEAERSLAATYTKKAIIIFLILLNNDNRMKIGDKKRKIEILKEVDYAMFDLGKREKLKNEIIKGLAHFEMKVQRTYEGQGKYGYYKVTAW